LKDSVSFMFIANNLTPGHVSISRFRERALPFFPDYFIDFVAMAADDGMLDMESVFGDGTKIKANASLHHAYSYQRAGDITEKLNAGIVEIEARLKEDDGTLRDALQKELDVALGEVTVCRTRPSSPLLPWPRRCAGSTRAWGPPPSRRWCSG
jgi:hypothetical protein